SEEGILEEAYCYNDEYSDFVMMRILSREWNRQRIPASALPKRCAPSPDFKRKTRFRPRLPFLRAGRGTVLFRRRERIPIDNAPPEVIRLNHRNNAACGRSCSNEDHFTRGKADVHRQFARAEHDLQLCDDVRDVFLH